MLDFLRRKTQSYGTYILLGLIIVTFVISFGPASNKLRCGATNVLASFGGSDITVLDWRYGTHAASIILSGQEGVTLNRYAMDKLLERKLLVDLAHDQGIRFMRSDAEDLVLKNKTVIFGREFKLSDLGAWPVDPRTGKPAAFNYDQFKSWVRYRMGFTDVNEYLDQLVEEMEAKAYRDAFVLGTSGSIEDRWADYQLSNLSMTLIKGQFSPSAFESDVKVSDDEARAMASDKDGRKQCEDEYTKKKAFYEKGPKVRHVKAVVFKMSPAAVEVYKEAGMKKPEGQFQGVSWADTRVMDALEKAKTLDATAFPAEFVKLGAQEIEMKVTEDATLGTDVFGADLKKLTGPVAGPDGIYFFVADKEEQTTYDKDRAIMEACRALLKQRKAEKKALEMANKALKALEAGKTPEEVFGVNGMPPSMEVGPVSPLEEQPPLLTRDLLKELWSLKPGQVLPKVETRDTGMSRVFYVLVLKDRHIPSRQEFLDEVAKGKAGYDYLLRGGYALSEVVYKRCKATVRKGELTIEKPLYRFLYYHRSPDLKPEEAMKLPPEKYNPCAFLHMGR